MSYLFRGLSLLALVSVLAMPPNRAPAVAPIDTLPSCIKTALPPTKSILATPGQTTNVTNDDAELQLGIDTLAEPTVISIVPLCEDDLPALDPGMTNVTSGPRHGYRFLPHARFRGKLTISLPYDKTRIPPGFTEQDIRTFYFDDQVGSWQELERATVDTSARVVVSLTDHFTDMINAVVTVPDHPQTLSFNPTSIKDIKVADPGVGINLIDAPQANSMGDARLSYPIELPPGRNGMQPQLGLSYDSSATNGWLGLGWDLGIPALTIDTRWGVPRYDAASETETYLLNGEQLTPVVHRGALQARVAEKIFHTRVETQFRKIIRHGTHPTNYWWEVIDKNGVRFFYGGDPTSGGPAGDSTLVDGSGNVFKWALREVRDLNGNGITYAYHRVADAGMAGGTVPGSQLYLRSINYTQSNGTPGAYTVTFIRDSELPGYTRRPDVIISARGGFKMVTAELLKRIDITFNGELIRRYDLGYQEGAFRKTLLRSITQYGENGELFHTHEFTYYDELRDQSGAYQGFDSSSAWNTGTNDNVNADLLNRGQASVLGGAINTTVGGHLYVGFNPIQPTKQFSAGGKVGYQHSSSDGVLALIDINGDSLPDKVFKRGGAIFFRLNRSGPAGTTVFGPAQALPSLPAIAKESSNTISFGPEVYVIANVFTNRANTFTTGSVYFSDANGDGLPDLVNGGQVLFNHLDLNGVPTFSPDSSSSPVPVGPGAVDANGIIDDYEAIYQQSIDTYPLHDTLRRWVAPYDGQIRITGDVALIQDTSPARTQYQTADGVRVAIQHNSSELWSTSLAANDYSPKTPTGVGSIAVQAGDRIYFRVQSVFDGAYDQVAWDTEIVYLGVPMLTDVNGLNPYRYRASEDFTLAGRREIHVKVPFNGTVRLTGDLRKLGVTTDDVTVVVKRNGVTVFNQSKGWDQTGDIAITQDITVSANDKIQLRVQIDSPIDLRQLAWDPRLFYVATPDVSPIVDDSGNYLVQLHPPYDIDLYPVDELSAPQQAWQVPQTGTVTVMPQLSAAAGANGVVVFTVKRQGALLAKRTIAIANGVVPNVDFNLDVTAGDKLFFDYSAYDPELKDQLFHKIVEVIYTDPGSSSILVPSAFHSATFPGLFAQPYRGWAYVGYSGNRNRATQSINESDLQQTFTEDSTYDPATAKAYLFNPFPKANSWRGPDELGWVTGDAMSSSRLGLDFIDVPRSGNFAGGRAVTRLSRTSQIAFGGGISFLSGSTSSGTSYGEVDYLDMNGDRFPDIVGNGRIQYTDLVGGLEGNNRAIAGLGRARESDDSAWNAGVGGSPASFKANSKGDVDTSGASAPKGNTSGSQMVSMGLAFSAGLGAGDSNPRYDLIDINGDGLPDRVSRSGAQLNVALNLGYSFASAEPWGAAVINDGTSENGSIGASLGFNAGIYDFAGGLSLSKNKSQSGQTLLDINGDGLLDRVSPNGNSLRVAFNTGNGFAAETNWSGALNGICRDDTSIGAAGIDWDKVRLCGGNTGLGGGAYFTIGIGPLCWPSPLCYIIINPGADTSQNMARQEAALRDVDGDGYADHLASTNDGSMTVARNRTGRTNLLKSIQRPLGARIDLEYQRDGNTYDQPSSRWVLAKVKVFDGHAGDGVDTYVTTYRYEHGFYNRLEREFYGYRKVTEEHRDAASGEALYRTIVREFFNGTFYSRGLLKRMLTMDAAGHRFTETEHTYLLHDVETGSELLDPQSTTATVFPQLVRTDQRFYEGNPAPGKSTYTTHQYDALGNIIQLFDAGDTGAQDDVLATIAYSMCPSTNVVGKPTTIVVTGDSVVMRRREATVDCTTGNLAQVRQYLENGDAAVTDLAYFANGNLRQVIDPTNKHGQRYQIAYDYDPVVQTHVTRMVDSFGYSSTATHSYKYGTLATTIDINGNQMTRVYDAFGRVISVTGPYEQGGSTPTIRFEYHPEAVVPWALTKHIDPFRSPTDTIDTVLFIDGLKRVIQTKKDATIHIGVDSASQDVMMVSGRSTFDFVGRTIEQFYPVVEALGAPGIFNASYDAVQPTRMTYDVLNRLTQTTIPDTTSTILAYGFGADRNGAPQFETTATDANGIQKKIYRNVRQLITSVKEFNQGGSQIIWTSYTYDALMQITQIIDDQDNRTTITYDHLGRRTDIDSPDSGRTQLVYDLASNISAKITANLRGEGKQISYDYEFNRLTRISYPNFTGNDVIYTYGAPGTSDNRAGRITLIVDESGQEERFYGKLGEITKEIKTVASDTQGGSSNSPEVYTTKYIHDTWGRLQTLTYPDGEVLTYRYDAGGLVRQAVGQKAGHSYDYVKRLEYDKFGQRAFLELGNNVRTSYTYDPLNRRLANLTSGKGAGNLFQNLNYSYDNVGNILSLSNDVPVPPPSQYGGPTTQTYTYDDLYRLTRASGTYQFAPNKINRYSLSLSYDTIHNIVAKQQTHEIVQPSGQPIPQHKTSYSFTYSYDGPQPHAPTHIDERTYTYDANGNQTGWTHDQNGTRRTIVWDEENRIQSLFDNGHEKTYKYDDTGERVIKRGPQGETAYVNQFFTIRNREVGTKHVFVDTTRLVSKLMKQDKPRGNPHGNPPVEKDQYFFHPDHLNSTNYVTDANGQLYEHLEYFPFGETWVEESSNTQRTPYLFTAKELDEETGLYYFGARYYDSRTSVWQSPDPALSSFLPARQNNQAQNLVGQGGVYMPGNLNLYGYVRQNPVQYHDPNGKWSSKEVPIGGILGTLLAIPLLFLAPPLAPVVLFFSAMLLDFQPVHQMAIQNVLGQRVDPQWIGVMQHRQVTMDQDQSNDRQFLHAMTGAGQDRASAIRAADGFVKERLDTARRAFSEGREQAAYEALGDAIHTLQDATSPSHRGFQVWNDEGSIWHKLGHVFAERSYPGGHERAELEGVTRWAYNIAIGQQAMPERFFDPESGRPLLPPSEP